MFKEIKRNQVYPAFCQIKSPERSRMFYFHSFLSSTFVSEIFSFICYKNDKRLMYHRFLMTQNLKLEADLRQDLESLAHSNLYQNHQTTENKCNSQIHIFNPDCCFICCLVLRMKFVFLHTWTSRNLAFHKDFKIVFPPSP